MPVVLDDALNARIDRWDGTVVGIREIFPKGFSETFAKVRRRWTIPPDQHLTIKMADDELAAIRAARLKELQQQSGQVSAFFGPSIMD